MLKMMRAGLARLAGGLAALALSGCATAPREASPQAGARPAMWKLADEDTTIYLFGTFHLLPEGHGWRTAKIEEAMTASNELVTEIGDLGDPMAGAQTMMKLGMSPGLPPLVERVPEGKRDELRQMVAESGIPIQVLDRMETWAASLSLLGVTFKRLGVTPEAGVEHSLTQGYKQANKPVSGLETVAEQFGFFDNLSEQAQRTFLSAALDDPTEMKAKFELMLKAWSAGDVEGIGATFNDDVNMTAELRDILLRKRNAKWADWLAGRLERPGTVFVAVGAGHLAGPDSVQSLLGAKGLKTRRVQ